MQISGPVSVSAPHGGGSTGPASLRELTISISPVLFCYSCEDGSVKVSGKQQKKTYICLYLFVAVVDTALIDQGWLDLVCRGR